MAYERALPCTYNVLGPNGLIINRIECGEHEKDWDDLDVRERKRLETAEKVAQRWYDNYFRYYGQKVSVVKVR